MHWQQALAKHAITQPPALPAPLPAALPAYDGRRGRGGRMRGWLQDAKKAPRTAALQSPARRWRASVGILGEQEGRCPMEYAHANISREQAKGREEGNAGCLGARGTPRISGGEKTRGAAPERVGPRPDRAAAASPGHALRKMAMNTADNTEQPAASGGKLGRVQIRGGDARRSAAAPPSHGQDCPTTLQAMNHLPARHSPAPADRKPHPRLPEAPSPPPAR